MAAFSVGARRAVPLLCALVLMAVPSAHAAELGRLFFTPEQRAQLDFNYARVARPDSGNDSALTLNGIVQRHGGKRTVWINGAPQAAGSSDERAPESAAVEIPGQSKSVKLKVGQRVLMGPSVSPDTTRSDMAKPGDSKHDTTGED
ncbi:MAG: hypothetical protein HY938_00550 [Nitrosomonadales bacterium]|nr:hypothetical protein [Nitrosomonadales bacterium]